LRDLQATTKHIHRPNRKRREFTPAQARVSQEADHQPLIRSGSERELLHLLVS
jgi:hypothetical protein